jgi:hypothetical protein
VALLISGAEQRTLPRQIWSRIRQEISPVIMVVATLLTALATILMVLTDHDKSSLPYLLGKHRIEAHDGYRTVSRARPNARLKTRNSATVKSRSSTLNAAAAFQFRLSFV